MKQSNIKAIVFSVIAFLLLTAALVCAFTLTFFHLSESDDQKTSGTEEQTETQTNASPSSDLPSEESLLTLTDTGNLPTETEQTDLPPESYPYVLAQTADAGQSYQDSIIFLGDSTTYHMIINEVLADKQNTHQVWYGKNGTLSLPNAAFNDLFDGTSEQGKLLSDMLTEKRPSLIVVTLGVGVSSSYNIGKFTAAYETVIDTIREYSPTTKIICNSMFPVCAVRSYEYQNLNNNDIRTANGWILSTVKSHYEKGEPVYYLDSFTSLLDADGNLPAGYSNGDGLHLSAEGYRVVLDIVRTHRIPDEER